MMDKKRFVVQRHDSSHLHYDFRLEIEGMLKSWAIPKEPTNNPKDKRLSIQVDDHSIDYADFEGVIPEGQYGAGKVKIWDKGNYEMIDRKKDKLVFRLFGKKLKGEFVLLKFKKAGEKSWVFFKKKESNIKNQQDN